MLAITLLYWKAWLVLLVLAATNPTTIGMNHSFLIDYEFNTNLKIYSLHWKIKAH